ncbi:DUF4492 domain-containing protein [Hydrogenimonas thermophila]|uniref:DUF4492 domain-containing protein n=1 Tax=Hydrogenimonas thermophila TaxID=223786 RepID=UPI00293732DF|nr:DUF4492 domain-containing protein [Hydrogenimonas thermophila]WOE69157.1 DUF4492 domain-containing protein [Hydrogenimonas thermophila]WOE71667.1 DUF4492 domain-containing protein [Hydrogenimonas thermophila]
MEGTVLFNLIKNIISFYVDGFRSMQLGKKLWAIIFIKIFILFVIIKLLFFPNVLKENFKNDQERSSYILDQLTQTNP